MQSALPLLAYAVEPGDHRTYQPAVMGLEFVGDWMRQAHDFWPVLC
jgi:hypothetical protein